MHAVTTQTSHNTAQTEIVEAAGLEFAYRRFGRSADLPLVMLQHFRGNLDNWDPALTDALASEREVILVHYPGVGASSGEFGPTIAEAARQMIAFVTALGLDEIDLLGFSIGGFTAQEIALVRPALVRRLILAATGPKGAPGMHGWREDIAAAARGEKPENLLYIMFAHTDTSQAKGEGVPGPVHEAPGGARRRNQRRRPRRPVRRDRRVGHPRPRRITTVDRDQGSDADHPGRERPDDPDQAEPPDGRPHSGRANSNLSRRRPRVHVPVPSRSCSGNQHIPDVTATAHEEKGTLGYSRPTTPRIPRGR